MKKRDTGASLQELFAQSRGAPICFENQWVVQMDRVPIRSGLVSVEFEGKSTGRFGVALKSRSGSITLSDGSSVPLLHIWDEPGMPRRVAHVVDCPDAELRVWNVFRTEHATGEVTEDAWIGNAGMIVECLGPNTRRFRCSSGPDSFDPDEFVFVLCWEENQDSEGKIVQC